jgi:hypothetical protein
VTHYTLHSAKQFFSSIIHYSLFIKKLSFKSVLFPLFIIHYSLFIISCTTSPQQEKSSLSGSVELSGAVDFSGVSVALYNLAYLDTTIVRINTEYPHIGVIISQETEFDHRLQAPVKVTQTDASGNFKLTDIRPGKYNLAFLKEGYSLKYLYNVSLSEGDNTISDNSDKVCHPERSVGSPIEHLASRTMYNEQCIMNNDTQPKSKLLSNNSSFSEPSVFSVVNKSKFKIQNSKLNNVSSIRENPSNPWFNNNNSITLLPSVTISSTIQVPYIFKANTQYIFNENIQILGDVTLEPGTVLTIAKDKKIDFYNNISSSNIGNRWKITSLSSINAIPTVQLDSTNYFGRITIHNQNQPNVILQNGIITHIKDGINIYPNNSIYKNIRAKYGFSHANIYSSNHLFTHNLITNFTQRVHVFCGSCTIEKNIFYNNIENMLLSENQATVQNNYFHSNFVALRPFYGDINIKHNNFHNNSFGISTVASAPFINYNNFFGSKVYCIQTHKYYTQGTYDYSNPIISYNNIYGKNICISLIAKQNIYSGYNLLSLENCGVINNIGSSNNYWKNTPIIDFLRDKTTYPNEPSTSPNYCPYLVIYEPYLSQSVSSAGIQ